MKRIFTLISAMLMTVGIMAQSQHTEKPVSGLTVLEQMKLAQQQQEAEHQKFISEMNASLERSQAKYEESKRQADANHAKSEAKRMELLQKGSANPESLNIKPLETPQMHLRAFEQKVNEEQVQRLKQLGVSEERIALVNEMKAKDNMKTRAVKNGKRRANAASTDFVERFDSIVFENSNKREYIYNEDGNLATYYYYYWDNDQWMKSWREKYEYTDNGYTFYSGYYDSESNQFINSEKRYFEFDERGNQTLYQYYYLSGGNWYGNYAYSAKYNENSQQIEYIDYYFNGEDWVPSYKYESGYIGNIQNIYAHYNWDSELNMWIGSYKGVNLYDEKERNIGFESYNWDNDKNSWHGSYKYSTELYDDGREKSYYNYYWDNYDESWHAYDRRDTEWENGYRKMETFYNFAEGEWYPYSRTEWFYTEMSYGWNRESGRATYHYGNGEWICEYKYRNELIEPFYLTSLEEEYLWDYELQELIGNYKNVYEYDDYGNEIRRENYYGWDFVNNCFAYGQMNEREYQHVGDYNNRTIKEYYYYLSNGKWIGDCAYDYGYDESGRNTLNGYRYGWNYDFGTWAEGSKTEGAYNENGFYIKHNNYIWSAEKSDWICQRAQSNEFDQNGNNTQYIRIVYNNDGTVSYGYKYEYTFDENNRLLKDECYEYHVDTDTWLRAYKYVYTYNEFGIETSEYYSVDIYNEYYLSQKDLYFYEDGQLVREEYYENHGSSLTEVTNYTYDANNVRTGIRRNVNTGDYTSKTIYQEDKMGRMLLSEAYYYEAGKWIPSFAEHLAYNENGRETLYEYCSDWSSALDTWTYAYKYEYAYDENDHETYYRYYGWNSSTKEWYVYARRDRAYDGDILVSSEEINQWGSGSKYLREDLGNGYYLATNWTWDDSNQDWVPTNKEIRKSEGNFYSTERYWWSIDANDWIGDYKYVTGYDSNGNQTQWEWYYWNGSVWVINEKYEQTFYDNGIRKSYTEYNNQNCDIYESKTVSEYDEQGYLTVRSNYYYNYDTNEYNPSERNEYVTVVDEQGYTYTQDIADYRWDNYLNAWVGIWHATSPYVYNEYNLIVSEQNYSWDYNKLAWAEYNYTYEYNVDENADIDLIMGYKRNFGGNVKVLDYVIMCNGEFERDVKLYYTKIDATTGINNIDANNADAIFDLQGRRVQTPQSGRIYIRGDKKVLVK